MTMSDESYFSEKYYRGTVFYENDKVFFSQQNLALRYGFGIWVRMWNVI
jgi:hypothetical protein